MGETQNPRRELETARDPIDDVDEASIDSFPASDPPAFTAVTHSGAPEHPDRTDARDPESPESSGEDSTGI